MKFKELAKGDRFRFFRRGTLLTKTGASTYSSDKMRDLKAEPDAEVLPEVEQVAAIAPQPADLFGASNRVDFQQGHVRLDGTFSVAQLEAVLAALKGQP